MAEINTHRRREDNQSPSQQRDKQTIFYALTFVRHTQTILCEQVLAASINYDPFRGKQIIPFVLRHRCHYPVVKVI